jgi:Glycosyl hydrolase family 26
MSAHWRRLPGRTGESSRNARLRLSWQLSVTVAITIVAILVPTPTPTSTQTPPPFRFSFYTGPLGAANILAAKTTGALLGTLAYGSTGFPASYYSGPLGANNILPARSDGSLLGVWPGGTGVQPAQKIGRLQALQTAAGRKIDVVAHHYAGGGTFAGQPQCAWIDDDQTMGWTIGNGSIVYLTWTPDRWTGNNDSTVRQIGSGARDACIDAMAVKLRGKGVRIMLRPFHEFDNHWTHPINPGYFRNASGTLDFPDEASAGHAFITAWRRIVDRFQAAGATNVGFFWSPDEGGGSRSLVGLSYPGNTYVDWVGSDRYNAAGSHYSACGLQGWADFYQIFNYPTSQCGQQNYHSRFAVANGKPPFVGETATRYDAATPSRKNTWYADIAKAKDPADTARYMSNLIGVSVFDQYIVPENTSDWRIDSNQTAAMATSGTLGTRKSSYGANGWAALARDARWNTR